MLIHQTVRLSLISPKFPPHPESVAQFTPSRSLARMEKWGSDATHSANVTFSSERIRALYYTHRCSELELLPLFSLNKFKIGG